MSTGNSRSRRSAAAASSRRSGRGAAVNAANAAAAASAGVAGNVLAAEIHPDHRTWTACCWAGKITRSAVLREGTEADKANLPAATVLNRPKPAGSKRKRKKGSAVRNTFARRVAGSLLGVSGGSGESGGVDFGRPSSSAGSGAVAGASTGSSRPTSRANSGGSSSRNDALAMPVELEYDTLNNRFSDSACECCDSGLLTRHRCRVEDPNSRYFYRESQGSTMILTCGKAFCVECQDRWNSESRIKCGDCLHLEIDERTKQQATAALANVGNERRQQKEFNNNDADAFFENIGM